MAQLQQIVAPQSIPMGQIKSFGPFGEKYEVGRPLRQLPDGDWMVEIKLIASGERAEYRLTHLLEDPQAV